MYRFYLALRKYRVVIEEVSTGSKPTMQPLSMLAKFLSSPTKRDEIVTEVDTLMSGDVDMSNYVLMAATIYPSQRPECSAGLAVHPRSSSDECITGHELFKKLLDPVVLEVNLR